MSEWIDVEKDEFFRLLMKYPMSKLTENIVRIVSPEVRSFDDFSDGKKWPESTVAQEILKEWYPHIDPGAKKYL